MPASPITRLTGCMVILLTTAANLLPASAAPRITEFLAENDDVIRDEDGETSDYIEIHNPEAAPISMAGFRLTDDPSQLSKWTFPDIVLQPGEFRIVWASGKNRTHPKKPFHTNFQIDRSAGYLALLPPGSNTPLTEFPNYPPQFSDRSYGLYQPEIITPLIGPRAPCRWLVPRSPLPGWQNPGFQDADWQSATTGIGYDLDGETGPYTPLFGENGDTSGPMFEQNATAYLRVPFTVTNRTRLSSLKLRMQSDDGFIVWINGARAASRFAPDAPAWDSSATALQDDPDALAPEEIDLSPQLGTLRDGENVLAIQALNGSPDNIDFLMVPELDLLSFDPAFTPETGYFLTATPGSANPLAEDGFTADTRFSIDRGFYANPFPLTISCATPGAFIWYTTDGSTPSPQSGIPYTAPITISRTTVIRAMATAPDAHPSNIDTQSYLFPRDILQQSAPPGYPATWGSANNGFGSFSPVPADYEMDPSVVNDPKYAADLTRSLQDSLPVVSLNADMPLWFAPDGIYADGRSGSSEIPLSVELFGPGFPEDLQIDAGVRIHGGNAREHPKKPLRLYFRKTYGTDKLRFPLFPDSPVRSFDQLILRPGGHDGWAVPFGNENALLAAHATYLRDQFLRLTETEMGNPAPRGRYVHVYLNGLYWGIYDLHERPNGDFYSSHLGGRSEDWDVVHHPTFADENYAQVDGSGEAWEKVLSLADSGIQSLSDYETMAGLVDLDNYIDHLIVRMWSGDYDWCGPVFLRNGGQEAEAGYFDNKNWYAARQSRGSPGKFLFHVWDAEMSMGLHLMLNRGINQQPPWLPYYPPQRIAGFDSTRVGTPGTFAWPYTALRAYPPFRQKFGDHLHRHLNGNGQLTTIRNLERLDSLTRQLELPLLAESARWGDVNRFNPFDIALTRDTHWRPEINWLRNIFIPGRNQLLLGQFRAIGLYPSLTAPTAAPGSGPAPPGSVLTLSHPSPGTVIYYTTDGSDPNQFAPTNNRELIGPGHPCIWWIPLFNIGSSWRTFDGPSNPDQWNNGQNGIGYDRDPTYLPHFATNVGPAMQNIRTSAYFRMEFTLGSQQEINNLTGISLEAKFDDGFIAAINGAVVQRSNAPSVESHQSFATAIRDDSSAVLFTPYQINLDIYRAVLRPGRNVLAVQGLNQSANSSDFLCTVRLTARTGGTASPAPTAQLYRPDQPPVIPPNTTVKARANEGTAWSPLTEITWFSAIPASRENLVPVKIHYHPAPPDETEQAAAFTDGGDFEYIELLNISSSRVDLSGCFFTHGISFDFANAAIQEIPPGQSVLVARNPAGIAFRYGPGPPVAGAFANDTGLSNSGERLRLQAADGSPIFDLTWEDNLPWPPAADGSGPGMILVNPRGLHDPAEASHWRASPAGQGDPGNYHLIPFEAWLQIQGLPPASPHLDDPDGDSWPSLMEYAAGTHPGDAASFPFLTFTGNNPGNRPQISFQINPQAASSLTLEESHALEGPWESASGLTEIPSSGNPTVRVYETSAPTTSGDRFFRLRATLP